MTHTTVRLLVITDPDGKLIGTQELSDQKERNRLVEASIKAGPEQIAHEIEINIPHRVLEGQDISEFHKLVQENLDKLKGGEQA